MRESQMKKIIASAVAVAFAAPVLAADITITGDQEFSLQDSNGASTSALDGDFNIKASTETANGFSVSADINYDTDGDEDGSSSLTISGPFGKIDAGDTSSALDAVDDVTDWGYVLTGGTPNIDAALLYTLPTLVEGLTLNYSMSSETNYASPASEGDGFSAKYSAGDLSVRYGIQDNKDDTEQQYVALTYSMAGIGLAAEQYTTTTAAGVDTDTDSMSLTYTTGDITLAIETQETSSAGATSADVTTMGIHYGMGGGVTAFVENTDDEQDATAETTAVGIAFKF
ncbi:MAG: porin [Oceanospirillales bacterium TMED33]|nr:hypothetical protein [Gammaproteobacteria bacterium]RPG22825.1 MAG: porin [Oceanospirillales bacterium TMED33]